MTQDTMKLWNTLKGVDKKFTKPITGKSYKGDSPNPTYIIMKLTEQLGPIGKSWGFEVKFDRIREGKPHLVEVAREEHYGAPDGNGHQPTVSRKVERQLIREEYHELCLSFWFRSQEGEVSRFDAFGGTPLLYMTKSGNWMHDEDAAKKSLTDAYTKGASWLGACADIFLGLFDDKYTSQPHNTNSGPDPRDEQPRQEQQRPPQDQQQPDQGGWDGNDPNPPQDQVKQPEQRRSSSAPTGW